MIRKSSYKIWLLPVFVCVLLCTEKPLYGIGTAPLFVKNQTTYKLHLSDSESVQLSVSFESINIDNSGIFDFEEEEVEEKDDDDDDNDNDLDLRFYSQTAYFAQLQVLYSNIISVFTKSKLFLLHCDLKVHY